jgi:hypothetical protein
MTIVGSLREIKYRSLHAWNQVVGGDRLHPSFFLIGTQKAGTTSLFYYLMQHQSIERPLIKEPHYYNNRDQNFGKGKDWYLNHFPRPSQGTITGECTPDYFDHPLVPARIHRDFPKAKLIISLRDPISRAYSAYRHRVRKGIEPLTFQEALEAEPSRIEPDLERMKQDETYFGYNFHHFAYLYKGLYAHHLKNWLQYFPIEQFLFIQSHALMSNPSGTVNQVLQFLEVDPFPKDFTFPRYNVGTEKASKKPNIPDSMIQKVKDDQDILENMLRSSAI